MQHRTHNAVVIALLLSGAAYAGCSREHAREEAGRRALLKPSDYRQQREATLRKQQVVDTRGELIPSEEIAGGIALPRGFKLALKLERKWYYRSNRVSFAALDHYFSARLLTGDLERGLSNMVTFTNAHIKDNSSAPRVTVRLTKLGGIGVNEATEVFIEQDLPVKLASGGLPLEQR